MSRQKLIRGIGEKTETVVVGYDAEIVGDGDGIYLISDEIEIASASEEFVGGSFLVTVQRGENDFYVPNESEAIDALDDIGRFYLAVKAGEV